MLQLLLLLLLMLLKLLPLQQQQQQRFPQHKIVWSLSPGQDVCRRAGSPRRILKATGEQTAENVAKNPFPKIILMKISMETDFLYCLNYCI
jgi:hypothetical protein